MANEIALTLKLAVNNGFLVQRFDPGQLLVTMAGFTSAGGVQSIGFAAAEALGITDVSTAGYAYFRNIDTVSYVEIGTGTAPFVPFMKLKAGEAAVLRLGTNAPTARANTAAVNLQYWILQD